MKIVRLWKCYYATGAVGADELHIKESGGIWESTHTDKQVKFQHISGRKPTYLNFIIKAIPLEKVDFEKFKLQDGLYCIYPCHAGVPYYFEEIKP